MPTLKDIKTIRQLTTELHKKHFYYRRDKRRLRQLINEKKACTSSGYIQHYPEYNLFIGSQLSKVRQSKRELLKIANTLKEVLYG